MSAERRRLATRSSSSSSPPTPATVAGKAGSVALVFGTRPEIIKLAGIARLLGPEAWLIHTGQHGSFEMARSFLDELQLGCPDMELTVGNQSRGRQIGDAVRGLDEHFETRRPSVVVVQGDTNTALAGALAANAREIPIVHVEAGLRSRDRAMPEEHNRVLTDHLADLCCAPTDVARENLAAEGIGGDRVVVTGNTVVDSVLEHLPSVDERRAVLARRRLDSSSYVLATFHRPENVDHPETLRTVLDELGGLPLPVVLPMHPRTAARARTFGLEEELSRISRRRTARLHRVPRPRGRSRRSRLGLRRTGGGGERAQATDRSRAPLDGATGGTGHLRRARLGRPRDR